MAIVIIGRPCIVKVPEIIAKEHTEEDEADDSADQCYPLNRITDRLCDEVCKSGARPLKQLPESHQEDRLHRTSPSSRFMLQNGATRSIRR